MKKNAIKILLIIAGLLVTSCTTITQRYSFLLLNAVMGKVDNALSSCIYTIPAILCALVWVLSFFGVPAIGIGLIIYAFIRSK